MSNKITTEILDALRNGDHKAFEVVFITYFKKIKLFIFGYIKSVEDAEELAEDLFVTLWTKRQSIDISKSFSAFMHTMARNAAINFLERKYIHQIYLSNATFQELTSTAEDDMIAKELGLQIDEVVDSMPAQRKQIYNLSRNEGLSNEEIALRLNTTKRNVESQLSLALKEIRKTISLFFLFI
jgi:RNA polymerase sigma-70 factor (ECF subfamily)